MLLTLLACGTVTTQEELVWYSDSIPCEGGTTAYWTAPDPSPLLAVARVEDTGSMGIRYTVLQASADTREAAVQCNGRDNTVTVTYAVRADTE